MRCDTYAPNPNCHTGHAQASSVHGTAFTGGELAGPSIFLGLALFAAGVFLTFSRMLRRVSA